MNSRTPLLDLHSVCVNYGKKSVLHKISFSVNPGEWVGIVGPNGSGKSTLLASVVGRLPLGAGQVIIAGLDLAQRPAQVKSKLGYAVPPESLPADLTGQQCLDIFAMSRSMASIDESTATLIRELKLNTWLHQRVGRYSLGTRQKLAVVLAMLGSPPLLVLDEVFNGLDPASALILKHCLQRRVAAGDCGVLLATHALDTVECFCSGAHLLCDGRLRASWEQGELELARRDRGHLERAMAAHM